MPDLPIAGQLSETKAPIPTADPYLATVRAEVAMEIVNGARSLIQDRIYAIEGGLQADEQEIARLNGMGSRLYALLRTIDNRKPAEVENVIKRWGALLRDETQFWKVMQDEHTPLAS